MGTNRLKENRYNKNRRKRNKYLFLLVVPAFILVSTMIIFYSTSLLNLDTLVTIYLPLMVLDFFLITYIQPHLALVSMKVDYDLLTLEDNDPMKTTTKLFTTSWINTLKKDGFTLSQDHPTHLLLYKFYKKLPKIANSDKTLVFIIIAKNNDFDFYGDEIDRAMQAVYMNNEELQKINKQITLQYKKFNEIDDNVVNEVESAILYKVGRQRMINLTIAYLEEKQSIYCLCPEKRYPNKYVYFACQEIKRLSNVKE